MYNLTFSASAQPIGFQTKRQSALDIFVSVPNYERRGEILPDAAPNALAPNPLMSAGGNVCVPPAQGHHLYGNNWTLESSAFGDEECLRNPHAAYLQLSGNAIPLQNVQDVPPLPPMLATIQTKTCLTIQHYVDEEEKGEKAEGGTREKEMEAATDANLFCELSFSSITCESSLINRIMAVQNDRTRTSFDISQHISGLSVWYNAEPNAIIFSFHLCALPSAGTLHCDYSGDGGVTVVSEFELVGQPRYAKYLASLGDGPLRLCDYVSQLRVFFQPGDPEEESSYGHKLLVSFDVNPAETVPDCDLLHEDLEDWEAQVQSGWFQFQCEDVLGPSSHSAAKLSPEDASARIPTYIKEGMPYQSEAQGIGISGPSHLLYERNNHLCVRDTAPTAEEVSRRLRCLRSRLNKSQTSAFWAAVL